MSRIETEFRSVKGIREFSKIVIREVDGYDEEMAAAWVDAKRKIKGENAGNVFNELVRASIASVDGKPFNVGGAPSDDFDKWSSRARNFVLRLYNELNGIDEDDLKKVIAEATVKTSAPLKATDGKRSED